MTAFIIDTETTSAGADKEPIQLAWLEPSLLGQSAESIHAIGSRMYKPKGEITLGARAVHHISPKDVEDCEVFDPAFDLAETGLFLGPVEDNGLTFETTYWIGHNVDFDWETLGRPPVLRICTLALARKLWPDNDSHTLSACLYFILGDAAKPLLRDAHDARADVLLCNHLLNAILEELPQVETWHDLWQFSEMSRLPTKMPFGKHKGTPIAQLDRGYMSWCLRQPDMDQYVLAAIRKYF